MYFDDGKNGAMLKKAKANNKIPVFYAYITAFAARYYMNLDDCDKNPAKSLCRQGANFIRKYRKTVIDIYKQHSSKIASYMGKNGFVVFLIEPDFYQYYGNKKQQNGPMKGEEMASFFNEIVSAIKSNLPNAAISWDISACK